MIQINALADNIYAFEERAGNIRCFLIIGKDRALLLDSGIGDVDFQEELPKLTKLPVTLVNTHGDFDHTAKNSLFTDRFVHPGDLPAIRRTHPEDLGEYKPLKEGDEFDLGGTVLTVLECPGHTEGSIMLFDKACGILFSGDSISDSPVWLFGPGRNQSQYISTLRGLLDRKLDIKRVIACHGTCEIQDYEELVMDLCKAVTDFLEGKPETNILHFKRGTVPTDLKRYISGRAQVLCGEVSKQ